MAVLALGCAGHSETTLLQGGKTAFAAGKLPQARAYFEEQVTRFPQGLWVLQGKTYLARIQLKQGDAMGGLATLDEALASSPSDSLGQVSALYWRGRIAFVLHRNDEALSAFSQVAVTARAEAEPATYFQGRALYRLGTSESARAVLAARLVSGASFQNGTHYWLARALYANGQCDRALDELAQVNAASTWRAGADLYALRCALQQSRATTQTVFLLHQFAADHPGSRLTDLALLLEGEALVQVKDFAAARALLSEFPRLFPGSLYLDAAAFWSARAAAQLGDCVVARTELTALLARRPRNNPFAPAIHLTVGECFYREGALAAAQVELEGLLARTPGSRWVPETHFALVKVNADLGQCAAARAHALAIPASSPFGALASGYLVAKGC